MAGNKITVDVRLTKEPDPVKESAKGVKFLSLKGLVEDTQDGPKWFDGVVFGGFAELVAKEVHKGMELRLEGDLTIKEYTKKDGSVGTGNNLVIKKVTLEGGKVVDKFTTGDKPALSADVPF